MKRTLFSLVLLMTMVLGLFGCFPQQQQKSQPTSEKQPIDISWVPRRIPENGIVNPNNLIDEATINKIQELNEKWINDTQPVRFIVLAVDELEFGHSIFAYSNAIIEKWNLDKETESTAYIILLIDAKHEASNVTISKSLQKVLPNKKLDKLRDELDTYLEARAISKGLLQYVTELDHQLHLTDEEKVAEIKTKKQEEINRRQKEKQEEQAKQEQRQQQFHDTIDSIVKLQILRTIFR